MKKLIILLVMLFIPFIVLAEECDISNITITSMKPNKIEGNTEVISEPTFEDRTINLNLKMYDVNDSITYDLVIKNDSEEDYMIDEDTFKTDSDYIEYTLKTKDNTNVVKAKNSKEVSLIVTYKKEIEDDKLTNNKFNASNSLKLSLNTSEKEQPLDIITTDNIKESLDPQEVKNPITSVSSMMLISTILLTSIVILYILIKRKNKYTKYLLILVSMLLIPTVYAICTCDIEVESTIEIEKKQKLFDTIANIAKEDNSCVTKYEGEVTDEVGKTVTATNVYFDKCEDKRNIIFGGFCWQVIRTTETGGIKMIYNGEPVDGKCENTREDHKGIVGEDGSTQTLNASYLYGNSFIYNTSTNTFTLIDTETATWSDSTYENILGKFTCKTTSDTCTTIYNVNGYLDNTTAYTSSYTIGDTNYAQIGTSSYNANSYSPAMVGYMFNNVYNRKYKTGASLSGTHKFGSTFTYNNGTYTLSGRTQNISAWSTGFNKINNTHYTCWNDTGTCNTISYVHYTYYAKYNEEAYYFDISDGKNVNDILTEMLSSDDVNRYNSSIKGIIDAWYRQNMLSKTNMLEDTVYCNARNIINYGGWDPNGGSTRDYFLLKFKNNNSTNDLSCANVTDQFAVNNNKANLTYPVALLENEERNNINKSSLMETGAYWWNFSPVIFSYQNADTDIVSTNGGWYEGINEVVHISNGSRPVVSLINSTIISSGTGSESDPWIIE